MPQPAQLRHLVACIACHRQVDASGHEAPGRFRCQCGEIVEIRRPEPHQAAVVKCSACGAPRQLEAPACRFCSSDFTIHELDLDTICPGCAARISRQARYCHACALPIAPQGTAGEPVEASCPVCGKERHLLSRSLGSAEVSVLECPRCAGMWLSGPTFQHLEKRATEVQISDTSAVRPEQAARLELNDRQAPLYRPCPACEKLMNRRNYGNRSGVIVDICSEHGVWFDRDELSRILGWIREGGLARAQKQDSLRHQTEARRPPSAPWQGSHAPMSTRARGLGALLEKVVGALLG